MPSFNIGLHSLHLSVAIPESALSDESLKIDKTRRASSIARACAIFGVQTVYVYRERAIPDTKKKMDRNEHYRGNSSSRGGDIDLLVTLLRYLETPQFLRKRLFPRVNDLKFAGVLQPLRIPSHLVPADPTKIHKGDIRDGVIVATKGQRFVDVGITDKLITYYGKSQIGKRVTIQFKEGHPRLSIKEIPRKEVPVYWGYTVKERASLHSLLTEWSGDIIITSRKGKPIVNRTIPRCAITNTAESPTDKHTLVVFGSPEKGVHEIMGGMLKRVQNAKIINFFQGQETQTVRLEEALFGVLAILGTLGMQQR